MSENLHKFFVSVASQFLSLCVVRIAALDFLPLTPRPPVVPNKAKHGSTEEGKRQEEEKMAAKAPSIQEDYMLGKGFRESARSAVPSVTKKLHSMKRTETFLRV